jgi:hypothetical protein
MKKFWSRFKQYFAIEMMIYLAVAIMVIFSIIPSLEIIFILGLLLVSILFIIFFIKSQTK